MFRRYAVFYTPPPGPLADFGAAWLGWDSATGTAVEHPPVQGVDVAQITRTPRKYGFHGTLKAPFGLAPGKSPDHLAEATAAFAATGKPVRIDSLSLSAKHGFVALRPQEETAPLRMLAADIVRTLDPFRAPLTEAYIARRRATGLTARQDTQMLDWGYPYIFEDFHFHLTLTGALDEMSTVLKALHPLVAPFLSQPLIIDAITLMGQDAAGMFHQIHRYALTG